MTSPARLTSPVRRALVVLRTVFANPELRRVELAHAAFTGSEWAVWIAMLVYAYGRGGTTTAGIVAVAQLVPATLFAPMGAVLGDRYRPGRVLLWSYVAQGVAMGVTGLLLVADGPALLAYAGAACATTAVTISRPTLTALVPSLARRPEELTAVNVVSSWIASVAVFVAPAAAGILLAVSEPGVVFLACSVAVGIGAMLVRSVPGPPPAGEGETVAAAHVAVVQAARAIRREPAARVLVALMCADVVALGALDVLYPQLAIGVLDQGPGWAAYLNAAFGAGATLAVLFTAGLVGRPRLAPAILLGVGLYAGSFVLLAAHQTVALAVFLLATAGVGRTFVDVSGQTLLQRVAPPDMLARVFGIVEALSMAALAVGSLYVTALVALGGVSLALLGVGVMLPLVILVFGRSLLDVDRHATVPVVQIGLLRMLPLFGSLPPRTLESTARLLQRVEVPSGTAVIREGEVGDRFYVVADGAIGVTRAGHHVATLGRGEGFGEIALLHATPRTATCVASADSVLFSLERGDFLEVLTGHPRARAEAEALATARSASAVVDDVVTGP